MIWKTTANLLGAIGLLSVAGCGGGGGDTAATASIEADADKQIGSATTQAVGLSDAQALTIAKQAFVQADRAGIGFSTPDAALNVIDQASAATAAVVSLGLTAHTAFQVISSGVEAFNGHAKETAPSPGNVALGMASARHCFKVLERSVTCNVTLWQARDLPSTTRQQVTRFGYRVQWWIDGRDLVYAAKATRLVEAFSCADAARNLDCTLVASTADEAVERVGYSGSVAASFGYGSTGDLQYRMTGTLPPPAGWATGSIATDYLSFEGTLLPSNQTVDIEKVAFSGSLTSVGRLGYTARLAIGRYDAESRFDSSRMTDHSHTVELLHQDPAQAGHRLSVQWKAQGLARDRTNRVAVPTLETFTIEASIEQDDGLLRRIGRSTYSIHRKDYSQVSVDEVHGLDGLFEHRFAGTFLDEAGVESYALTKSWSTAADGGSALSESFHWADLSACACFDLSATRTETGYSLVEAHSGYTWAAVFAAPAPAAGISRASSSSPVGAYDGAGGVVLFSDGFRQRFSLQR